MRQKGEEVIKYLLGQWYQSTIKGLLESDTERIEENRRSMGLHFVGFHLADHLVDESPEDRYGPHHLKGVDRMPI